MPRGGNRTRDLTLGSERAPLRQRGRQVEANGLTMSLFSLDIFFFLRLVINVFELSHNFLKVRDKLIIYSDMTTNKVMASRK